VTSPLTPHKTALITGASSGIGKALAYHFAQDGYQLVLAARGVAKMQALADELAKANSRLSSPSLVPTLKPTAACRATARRHQSARHRPERPGQQRRVRRVWRVQRLGAGVKSWP
jgi:NAD(P)-dependent dehydrogenase (short-subunit alcohol dehydrogenase family)